MRAITLRVVCRFVRPEFREERLFVHFCVPRDNAGASNIGGVPNIALTSGTIQPCAPRLACPVLPAHCVFSDAHGDRDAAAFSRAMARLPRPRTLEIRES